MEYERLEPYMAYPPMKLKVMELDYLPLNMIRRVIHLDDYKNCLLKNALKSGLIDSFLDLSKIERTFSDEEFRILWFAPAEDPEKHNYYGNVAFDITLEDVKKHFGEKFRMYYIEYVHYPSSCCTRILITRKDLRKYVFKKEVIDITDGTTDFFMPLVWDDYMDALFYAHSDYAPYITVDFMIDCEEGDEEWFFKNCTKEAVNHSSANSRKYWSSEQVEYEPRSCHKHNNRPCSEKETCPTPYTRDKTLNEMEKLA